MLTNRNQTARTRSRVRCPDAMIYGPIDNVDGKVASGQFVVVP